MNDQMASPTPAAIMNGAPEWLTLPFVLIALGVLFALFILWWGAHLAKRRRRTREELEERGEAHYAAPGEAANVAPPVAPAPPPIADAPLPASAPTLADPVMDERPEPAPFADEPIAAAAPMEASPASLAASEPAPAAPAAPAADDLTRMKGVGPRLAERLNAAGITSFAQLAALSPEEAEALDARLGDFRGRIHRDRWIEQAGFLARGDTAGYEGVFGKL
jgi:predicted flap endonuclease-1-like 5' DNA nuclease